MTTFEALNNVQEEQFQFSDQRMKFVSIINILTFMLRGRHIVHNK